MFRTTVVIPGALLVLWMNKDFLLSKLFPYGIPHRLDKRNRPSYNEVDAANDSLQHQHGKLQKIYERRETGDEQLLRSAETVFFGPDGTLFTTTDQGYLISLTDFHLESDHRISAKTTLIKDLGNGRPLGAKFSNDGTTIYIADAALGLLRLRNPFNEKSKVEIIASSMIDGNRRTPFNFLDDLVIGPRTGKIYFTDASSVPPPRNMDDLTIDAMYGSKIDAILGEPSGRLLEYDPVSDRISILARNLSFANGVAVDKDEKYLVFAETFRLSIGKYHLTGPMQGQIEYIVQGHPSPAYFDGVDCAWKGQTANSSLCYAANPAYMVAANGFLLSLPHPLDWIMRTILIILPKEWLPKTKPYGGITILDAESLRYVGLIQDPNGKDIGHITGVTVHDNKLYLGSLENDFVGVYDLGLS